MLQFLSPLARLSQEILSSGYIQANNLLRPSTAHQLSLSFSTMPGEVVGESVEALDLVAVLALSAYFILLACSSIACFCTVCYVFWKYFGDRHSSSPAITSMDTTSDEVAPEDEGPDEEYVNMEFADDTDEEYMRRPY